MSVTVSVDNTNYTIPQTDETGWGDNVTSWIQAISSATLQKSGGTFTLSAEVDFGASFGLKSLYFKGRTANPSSAGVVRLAVSDSVGWRNNANSANLLLAVNGSDALMFNSVVLTTNSDTIPVNRGGTNITSYTVGDLLYASGATTLSKLAIGTAGQVLKTNAGATAPEWGSAASALAVAAKTADYTLLSTDDFITVDSDADANGFTITLPDNATNTGKVYTIKRIGTTFATARAVTIARAGSDTITDATSGLTSTTLNTPGEEIQIVSLGTGVWQITQRRIPSVWTSYTPTIDLTGGATTGVGFWRRVGDSIEVRADFTFTTVFTGGTPETNIPTGLTFDTAKIPGTEVGATVPVLGMAHCYDVGSDVYVASAIYASTTGVVCRIYIDDAGTSSGYVATANAISTTNPFTWANNDRMLFYYTAPVTGWNG